MIVKEEEIYPIEMYKVVEVRGDKYFSVNFAGQLEAELKVGEWAEPIPLEIEGKPVKNPMKVFNSISRGKHLSAWELRGKHDWIEFKLFECQVVLAHPEKLYVVYEYDDGTEYKEYKPSELEGLHYASHIKLIKEVAGEEDQ